MRIGIIALQHESNTFISTPTTLELFRQEALLEGQQVIDFYADAHHEVGGFIESLRQARCEVAPIFAAWANPSGVIQTQTYRTILNMLLDGLDAAGELDGLLVAPHGAGVCQEHRDMDGHWLSAVRQKIGPDKPMICTLDAHANLSKRMIDACNATIIYRSNPHLDQRQRGLEAGRLLVRTLLDQVKPTQAAAFPPIAINIERQTTELAPCKPMYHFADQLLQRDGILSNSIALGFPYGDVEEMGTSFVTVTDNNPVLAQQLADEMANYLWQHRQTFVAELIGVEEALDQAQTCQGPVCLLDMGDNVGGGSSADGTPIAHAIHRRQSPRTFISINDPQAMQQAAAAGIGATLQLTVGGKVDNLHGDPLTTTFTVRSLHDGVFTESQPRHGGRPRFDMGPTAIVETKYGLTVQLTSIRTVPFSLGQVTSCGLDPANFYILVAKGVVAPRAAYEQVCRTFIRVNTPGSTTADMVGSLDYRFRRRPLFPFETEAPYPQNG